MKLHGIEHEANMIYLNKTNDTTNWLSSDVSLAEVVSELETRGYKVGGNSVIEDIRLRNSSISIDKNGTANIEVEIIEAENDENDDAYYLELKGKNYKINETSEGIIIDREPSEIEGGLSGTLGANIKTGTTVTIGNIGSDTITLNGGNTTGTTVINVTYGDITRECYATVVVKPTASSVEYGNTTFSTNYGTIDVIWLNTDNTVRSTPNPPVLSGMTPVTWTYYENGKKDGNNNTIVDATGNTVNWFEDTLEETNAKEAWYNYYAEATRDSSTGHTIDNRTSMWANAKNTTTGGESYFVWIPRYAYRITYYSGENSIEPTGYYDGWGQWRASDGSLRLALDDGVETVTYNGNKYIVHPAFCKGTQYQNGTSKSHPYDLGEWDSQLSGFWVAKYEMSRTGATASSEGSGYNTTFISIPNVQSARGITIGNMYAVAKAYDSSKESHMMKNSEWGAVAYLTHSQYGRNGNEIDNNVSEKTGSGFAGLGKNYEYNTNSATKASTTGNIYGVYDMAGNSWEYVAAFNISENELSMYGDSIELGRDYSDKYLTKYYNEEIYDEEEEDYITYSDDTYGNIIICSFGKIGDATKEVNQGGNDDLYGYNLYENWFEDYPMICCKDSRVIIRGGLGMRDYGRQYMGLFTSRYETGDSDDSDDIFSFRTVLCP